MKTETKREVPIENSSQPKLKNSTLIEFPGKKRQEIPQWRKELQEKFRAIQEKRAREAELENGFTLTEDELQLSSQQFESVKPQLEVVPSAPVNPIVAAALARIERAHKKPTSSLPKTRMGRASVAIASLHVEEEEPVFEEKQEQKLTLVTTQITTAVQTQPAQSPKVSDTVQSESKAQNLNQPTSTNTANVSPVTMQKPITTTSLKQQNEITNNSKPFTPEQQNKTVNTQTTVSSKPVVTQTIKVAAIEKSEPKKAQPTQTEPIQDELIKALENVFTPQTVKTTPQTVQTKVMAKTVKPFELNIEEFETQKEQANQVFLVEDYDDYAPIFARTVSLFFDVLVILFATSPFAAILELGGVDWTNGNVILALGAIVSIVSFVYLMASVSLLGRTWGMAVLSLRVADDTDGYAPTFLQSCKRAIIFMLSAVALGLPFLYALFDAEGRALHDKITGTIVIRDN